MTEEEKREHALRIAKEWLSELEFSYVYEDEALEDAGDYDLMDILSRIYSEVRVSLDD